jgi:hypothetical protein
MQLILGGTTFAVSANRVENQLSAQGLPVAIRLPAAKIGVTQGFRELELLCIVSLPVAAANRLQPLPHVADTIRDDNFRGPAVARDNKSNSG